MNRFSIKLYFQLSEDTFFNYVDEKHQNLKTKPMAIITKTLKTNFFEEAWVLKDLRFLKIIMSEQQIIKDYLIG